MLEKRVLMEKQWLSGKNSPKTSTLMIINTKQERKLNVLLFLFFFLVTANLVTEKENNVKVLIIISVVHMWLKFSSIILTECNLLV